ncbi:YihY/virulence factor BrkB family protein [Homoserinibacter sp. YIM 151385]|uniref:YihY/virulence factor BrkB family protein n=1 Tax=Homoserinibacter sp. YIM 151385 TaxID=2985506 RepID=UPI0022F0F905|nr:YihY/virulence factor BrkB family protein [Homoserinibacter sp. YIM 151385]WBU38389.1 YihY/virulence factor BrkB family protein [Homoserinibacter sp. YIM 151385]
MRRRLPRGARRAVLRRAAHGFLRHRGLDAAAALTFFATLSALPATLVVVSGFALAQDRDRATRELSSLIGTFAGDAGATAVEGAVGELLGLRNPGLGLAVGLVLLLWSVSGYATAFGRAVNTVHEAHEGRQLWRFRGTMLLLAAVLIALGAVVAASLLITPAAADSISGGRGWDPLATGVWSVARWALLPVALLSILSLLHGVAPNVRLPGRRYATSGALVSLGLWAVATTGFAAYAVLIGGYSSIYGGLGLGLVALLWLYVSNLSVVLGAEIDGEIIRLARLLDDEDAEEHTGLPVRDTTRLHMIARQQRADIEESARIRREARELG